MNKRTLVTLFVLCVSPALAQQQGQPTFPWPKTDMRCFLDYLNRDSDKATCRESLEATKLTKTCEIDVVREIDGKKMMSKVTLKAEGNVHKDKIGGSFACSVDSTEPVEVPNQ